jgi:hypothetical protein
MSAETSQFINGEKSYERLRTPAFLCQLYAKFTFTATLLCSIAARIEPLIERNQNLRRIFEK